MIRIFCTLDGEFEMDEFTAGAWGGGGFFEVLGVGWCWVDAGLVLIDAGLLLLGLRFNVTILARRLQP